ncbi:MAG TPA: hypothetical protein VKV15_00530, partial [Bryobacteraceae bacterium]|nr:hypothetical protein [Bryobacteraceae bacterium]
GALARREPPGSASGVKLIYSTAVSGSGNTTNAGLAVHATDNARLAGASYPFSPNSTRLDRISCVPRRRVALIFPALAPYIVGFTLYDVSGGAARR